MLTLNAARVSPARAAWQCRCIAVGIGVPTYFKSGGILMRDPAKSRLDTQVSLRDAVTGAGHLPLGDGRRQPTVPRRDTACYVSCCIRTSPAGLVRKLAGRAAYTTQSFVDGSNILCAHSALCGVQRVAARSHIPPNGCPDHGLPCDSNCSPGTSRCASPNNPSVTRKGDNIDTRRG
jgi:hypothetical protein